jgi:hypothetical protein
MLFPWPGMLEQLRLADAYVHYDDVQFSKGSFTNRVQIKTAHGIKWLTVPLRDLRLGQPIAEVQVDESRPWRASQLAFLEQAYAGAPYAQDALGLVRRVHAMPTDRLVELATASMQALGAYFEITPARVLRSSEIGIGGKSTDRVRAIVQSLQGDVYVTGHGARRYLDHASFDACGIAVAYMDYRKQPYPQLHGEFTPYVSALDLVANVGRAGRDVITSGTIPWKEFVERCAD